MSSPSDPRSGEVLRAVLGRDGATDVAQRPTAAWRTLAHLGGLVVGYVYLTRGRGGPMAELKYRWLKWRMARMRRRFDVWTAAARRTTRGGFTDIRLTP